jgi:hypothetical protein
MKTTYERGIEAGIERGLEQARREVEPLMKTTYERGIEQGMRRTTLRQLEVKFGPLAPQVKQQVEALSPGALAQLQLDLLKAQSFEELGLEV